ncbi:MAG TPA: hypothetical protein VID51_10355 [Solirubrobacterales bacterium]
MYDGEGQRKMDREEYVRGHPIRAKLLALYEQDDQRSLSPDEPLGALSDVGVTAPLVAYHLRVLSVAGLLPRADD